MNDCGFPKKNLIQRLRMPLPELEAYYRAQREYELEHDAPVRGVRWRKAIHPLLAVGIRLSCLARGQRLTIVADRRRGDRPVVYAITHQGRYDIEIGFMAAKEQYWLFYGDPGPVYQDLDGLALFLNGTVYVDTAYRRDCFCGKERSIKLLKSGGSVMIAPEGAWNITDNLPVLPLFDGTAEMAIRAGVSIVPIALEKYGNSFFASVGEEIDSRSYVLEDKKSLSALLRDRLASLKWEIWESRGVFSRAELPSDAAARYLNEIMSETENGYTVEEIERTRYHDKTVTPPDEAFAYLSRLV